MTAPVPVRNGIYVKINDLNADAIAYLNSESARWGIPASRLASLLLKIVCEDRMINAVLDEERIADLVPNKARRRKLYAKRNATDL